MTDVTLPSNSNDDYLQKLRDAHPMECYRKALQKIASKRYGCCGADRIAQEALGNEATGNETRAVHREGTEPISRLAGDLDWCLAHMTPGHEVYKTLQRVRDQIREVTPQKGGQQHG